MLYDLVGQKDIQIQERCLRVPQGSSGRIIRISYTYLKTEQNQKNSFPLSESSLTKLKTKVQTGPKLTLAKTFINKVKQTQPLVFPLPSEASYLADWQLHSKAMGTKKFSQTSPEGRPKVRGEGMSRPVPWGDLLGDLLVVPIRDETTRSFFPFFIQNLHYSYFIRKSFRHFCQSNLCWTNILEKTPGRTKTGSNDRLTVFKKMYNNRQTDSRCQQQNGHRETLPAAVWAKQTAQSKVSHRRDTRTGGSNISSYLNKNKKFVTIISRWLWLYKSLVTKNNYLFTEVGQCPISLHAKRYLHQRIFPGEKKTRFLNQTLIAHRQIQAFKWGNKDFSLTKRFNNFISINQRNFQKIVFEKPNEPIQIPKIIPRISTILDRKVNCLQTFQKNQNRLRQQSQKKLLRTPLYAVSTQKRRALYREPEGRPEGHPKERDKNLVSYGIQFKNIWNSVPFFALAKARDINHLPHSPMGPSLPLKAFKKITIYIAEKREFQVGDKISGRHGNKGIISQIFSNYDMPYLVSGDTLDVLLNPLGVPSRMNVGQILECLLGFTGQIFHTKFQILCFDEIYGYEASRSFIYSKIFELCQKMRQKWLFSKKTPGKLNIFDGRNGQLFHQSVMVGSTYLMKLIHIVDEKIHARGTGPYSLITQQPLRGRAKHGGQRFGEMEVWALQGFGSAYTLQELLTVKSDDLQGRNQIMQTLLKNTPLRFGTPESLRVVLRELQCLCLDLQLSTTHHKVIRQFPGEK